MKPEKTQDILELMEGYLVSAALGAAMELGLFWLLDRKPLPAADVGQLLDIPLNRCQHWLQILCKLGLLEDGSEGYAPSALAQEAILLAQSQATWAFQAREYRDSALLVGDLPVNICKPISTWQLRNPTQTDYFQHIQEDTAFAAQFTRKLFEIHLGLADQLARALDLRGVRSLLDLGGGSGVASFALLRKNPDLTSVVVDVENVCQAGREIALENRLEDRITYLAADFLQDALPSGYDMVLLCDVGVFDKILLSKVYNILNRDGRLVIVDKFAQSKSSPSPSRLSSAFLDAMVNPAQSADLTTMGEVQDLLPQAGFVDFSITPLPHIDDLPWNIDWILMEAWKMPEMGDV